MARSGGRVLTARAARGAGGRRRGSQRATGAGRSPAWARPRRTGAVGGSLPARAVTYVGPAGVDGAAVRRGSWTHGDTHGRAVHRGPGRAAVRTGGQARAGRRE